MRLIKTTKLPFKKSDLRIGVRVLLFDGSEGMLLSKKRVDDIKDGAIVRTGGLEVTVQMNDGTWRVGYVYGLIEKII